MIKAYIQQTLRIYNTRFKVYAGLLALLMFIFLLHGTWHTYQQLDHSHTNSITYNLNLNTSALKRLRQQIAILQIVQQHIKTPQQQSLLDTVRQALNDQSVAHYQLQKLDKHTVELRGSAQHKFDLIWLFQLLHHHPQLEITQFRLSQNQLQIKIGEHYDQNQ